MTGGNKPVPDSGQAGMTVGNKPVPDSGQAGMTGGRNITKLYLLLLLLPLLVQAQKPNIVFFLTDDQGYTDFGANTPEALKDDPMALEVSTPHMDALRESGVLFTDAHSNGNVCSPTRASLVIGRYSQHSGWYGAGDSRYGLDFNEVTIADDLKKEGYRTGMFGKWHVGVSPLHNPINRGFDKFYGFLGHGAHDFYDLSSDPLTHASGYNNIRDGIDPIDDDGEYLTWRIREETINFIDSAKADNKPYFAFVCFNAVHSPAQSPPTGPWSNPGKSLRDTLMAMLSDLDNAIGEIVDHVDEMGDSENTLFILMSDNGGAKNMGAWNGGLRGFKTSNFEGGIRVPLVMSWKGKITPGTRYDNMVMGFDIYPTAIKAAGGTPHDTLDGVDLMPYIQTVDGPAPLTGSVHEFLIWNRDGPDKYAIRNEDFKLYVQDGDVFLFDMKNSIDEADPITNNSVQNELESYYQGWVAQNKPQLTTGNICQDPRYDNYEEGPGKHLYDRCEGRRDITGCTNPENPAYDWMANIHDESLCDEIIPVLPGLTSRHKVVMGRDGLLHIKSQGLYDVKIYDIQGNLAGELAGLAQGAHPLPQLGSGVHFFSISQGSYQGKFKHLVM